MEPPRRVNFWPCPKCGEIEPHIEWHDTHWQVSYIGRVPCQIMGLSARNHFHALCTRCNYGWPADLDGSYIETKS